MAADFDTNLLSGGLTTNDVLEYEVAKVDGCHDEGPPEDNLTKSSVPTCFVELAADGSKLNIGEGLIEREGALIDVPGRVVNDGPASMGSSSIIPPAIPDVTNCAGGLIRMR